MNLKIKLLINTTKLPNMSNYQNGKIYRIKSLNGGQCYIGSTIKPLTERYGGHMYRYKKQERYCSVWDVLEKGDCIIELVKKFPCNSRKELEKEEGKYQKKYDCVNCCIAGRTRNEYYQDNKEYLLKQHKKYRERHKEHFKIKNKEWREKNKEIIKEKDKKYYEANKEKIAKRQQQKTKCDNCGSIVHKNNMPRHKRSIKCKNHSGI